MRKNKRWFNMYAMKCMIIMKLLFVQIQFILYHIKCQIYTHLQSQLWNVTMIWDSVWGLRPWPQYFADIDWNVKIRYKWFMEPKIEGTLSPKHLTCLDYTHTGLSPGFDLLGRVFGQNLKTHVCHKRENSKLLGGTSLWGIFLWVLSPNWRQPCTYTYLSIGNQHTTVIY